MLLKPTTAMSSSTVKPLEWTAVCLSFGALRPAAKREVSKREGGVWYTTHWSVTAQAKSCASTPRSAVVVDRAQHGAVGDEVREWIDPLPRRLLGADSRLH